MIARSLEPNAAGAVDAVPRRRALEDSDRLAAIADLRFRDRDVTARLTALVEQAARAMSMPIALCNIVLDDAQVFVAARGLDGTWMAEVGGTPVEWAFCANVIERGEPFVVTDATEDPVLAVNPLVVEDGIRSYLGVPLTDRGGATVGSLCTIDMQPRDFDEDDLAVLRDLADAARRVLDDAHGTEDQD